MNKNLKLEDLKLNKTYNMVAWKEGTVCMNVYVQKIDMLNEEMFVLKNKHSEKVSIYPYGTLYVLNRDYEVEWSDEV